MLNYLPVGGAEKRQPPGAGDVQERESCFSLAACNLEAPAAQPLGMAEADPRLGHAHHVRLQNPPSSVAWQCFQKAKHLFRLIAGLSWEASALSSAALDSLHLDTTYDNDMHAADSHLQLC